MKKLMNESDFLLGLRHLALSFVDLLERQLTIEPRTAEIRKWYKQEHRTKPQDEGGK